MSTPGGFIDTIFALLIAMMIVSIIWGLAFYYTEFGSQEGMKEAKNVFMGGITWLMLLMMIYAVVEWIRTTLGF